MACSDPCYRYAVAELQRLLERLGVACRFRHTRAPRRGLSLGLAARGTPAPRTAPAGTKWDGYAVEVTSRGVAIAAPTAKGVLNGVYDLAERLGVLFLLPGDDGEWMPEGGPRPLAVGRRVREPRFPFRGVFFYPMADDYPVEAWLRFYAKLRFNNVGDHGCTVEHPRVWPRMAEFGLRHEAGGHGLARLVARDLFQTAPDRFRMSQPEDFGGKRTNDLNFCVTNPANRRLIRQGFRQALRAFAGLHAVHVYADDLPGGGWCYCPSCRALTPADQNMLAMRYLAEGAAEAAVPMRVPCVAYHDTLFPGTTVPPAPACSLLFAPRERCYGHALNDPACAKNRHHLAALRAWRDVFRGLDDAHTFEYYFDQILFRGLYPYLPHVILGDLAAYRAHGIEACLALQIAGPALAPDYNMLLFARAHWDAGVTAASFARDLARAVLPQAPGVWRRFLDARGAAFERAMRVCDVPNTIYFDYRWQPELPAAAGADLAGGYGTASAALDRAAEALVADLPAACPARVRAVAERERRRIRFEAAELRAMARQQEGLNALTQYHLTGADDARRNAVTALRQAADLEAATAGPAREAGIPENNWYFRNINAWIQRELKAKAARYRLASATGSPSRQKTAARMRCARSLRVRPWVAPRHSQFAAR